jgi:antirestriction protein
MTTSSLSQINLQHRAEIQIYVACLASYNNGILFGEWIDATQSEDEIRSAIASMLKASPIAHAEEYAIHDYEGFEDVRIEEYSSIEFIVRVASFIEEHGRIGSAVIAHFSGDIDEAQTAMENSYHGCFASLADFMQDIVEQTTAIPENLAYYIDWNAMARDAEMGGDYFTVETAHDEVHIFSS